MTLILTTVGRGGVVQVTDRLVTLDPGGKPHDRLANKSVICRTSDGLFAFSYSGPAYFREVTTDSWLATILWGGDLGKPAFLAGATRPRVINIGLTLHRLRDALQKAYDELPRTHPSCYVVVAGRQDGRVPRVTAYEIRDDTSTGRHIFEISKVRREIPKGKLAHLRSPGMLRHEEDEDLRREIRDCRSIDAIEDAMVRTVRRVASREPRVGADCMSIAIAWALDPNTRARFIPHAAESRVLGEGTLAAHGGIHDQWRGTPVQIGFSPYILGRSAIHFPSELVGSGKLRLGDFSVLLDAPGPGVPNVGASSQDRPRRP